MATSVERRLADLMGYEYCILFPRARDAVRFYAEFRPITEIPSNCCPVLAASIPYHVARVPVYPKTGLATDVPVQLYGYRQLVRDAELEIDPLMTGVMGQPFAKSSIISFGWGKTIELGAGGALLTNDRDMAVHEHRYVPKPYFPQVLREPLAHKLENLHGTIQDKWLMMKYWDQLLGDTLTRIPQEVVVPWRIIRRVPNGKRDVLVKALRAAGYNAGTNYPPLYGVTHPDAVTWGEEVINLWGVSTDISATCDTIKRAME